MSRIALDLVERAHTHTHAHQHALKSGFNLKGAPKAWANSTNLSWARCIFYQTQVWWTIPISVALHIIAGVLAVGWSQSAVIVEIWPPADGEASRSQGAKDGFRMGSLGFTEDKVQVAWAGSLMIFAVPWVHRTITEGNTTTGWFKQTSFVPWSTANGSIREVKCTSLNQWQSAMASLWGFHPRHWQVL